MSRKLVAGIDSSTQSVKIVVRDADTGELMREVRAAHPDGTEVNPELWWQALESIARQALEGVSAVSVAPHFYGMTLAPRNRALT